MNLALAIAAYFAVGLFAVYVDERFSNGTHAPVSTFFIWPLLWLAFALGWIIGIAAVVGRRHRKEKS